MPAASALATRLSSRFRIAGIEWEGDRTLVEELFDEQTPTFTDLADSGRATIVKSGPHRTVYRIERPGGAVYLKHFKTPDWRALARNVFLRTPAEREAAAATWVRGAGIDTFECAASGVARGPLVARDSFLISHEIPAVQSLEEMIRGRSSLTPGEPVCSRHELARSLGRLAGLLHRCGLTHDDFHPGNILVRKASDGSLGLWLIDLQRIRRHRFLSLSRARVDLFALFNFFPWISGRSDRRRFFRAYWEEALAVDSRLETAARERTGVYAIENWCRGELVREQLRNDRKWQRSNRRLIVADRRGERCRGLATLGRSRVLQFRDDPDSLFRAGNVRFWRRRSVGERSAVIDLIVDGQPIACDVVEQTGSVRWIADRLGPRWTKLRRTWEMSHALLRRGVSTTRPLLYIEKRSPAAVHEVLVCKQSEGVVTLAVFMAHHLPSLPAAERNHRLIRIASGLGSQLRRMHDFALVHRDLSVHGVLVSADSTDLQIGIGATDEIECKRRLSQRDVVRGLSQLRRSVADTSTRDVRKTLCLRFLRRYLGGAFRTDWKQLWLAVAAESPAVAKPSSARIADSPRLGRVAALVGLLSVLLVGCQSVDRPLALPVKHEVRSDQLLVLSDFKLPENHERIRELKSLREQVAATLELPLQRNPVVVYLFTTETQYRKYMNANFPNLPPRSAYFVGTPTELAVYTHWGDSVREDLRHEYTHGLLHSAMKKVPLWLDEGLAEYFEVAGPRPGGVNHEHAKHLAEALAAGWQPDLKRLENLNEFADMNRAEYQEAWGWVHFMLHSTPEAKQVLVGYLKDLRTMPEPKPISQRLRAELPEFQERFTSYVSRLQGTPQTVGSL